MHRRAQVKRDRLPSANSLQAQHLLRSAWNVVDTEVGQNTNPLTQRQRLNF